MFLWCFLMSRPRFSSSADENKRFQLKWKKTTDTRCFTNQHLQGFFWTGQMSFVHCVWILLCSVMKLSKIPKRTTFHIKNHLLFYHTHTQTHTHSQLYLHNICQVKLNKLNALKTAHHYNSETIDVTEHQYINVHYNHTLLSFELRINEQFNVTF